MCVCVRERKRESVCVCVRVRACARPNRSAISKSRRPCRLQGGEDPLSVSVYRIIYRVAKTIGCLKLQVILCKRATNCRALLRKMTYKDTASYGFLPPCRWYGGVRHFSQKSPIMSGAFAERDLQLKASYGSLPPHNDTVSSTGTSAALWFVAACKRATDYRALLWKMT